MSTTEVTVTVAESFAVPPAPVHETLYDCVANNAPEETEPFVAFPVEKPVPVHVVAFADDHTMVVDWPDVIEDGVTVMTTVGSGGGAVEMFTDFEEVDEFAPREFCVSAVNVFVPFVVQVFGAS